MTRRNDRIKTSILQQRVTTPHRIRNNIRKPIQPDITVITKQAVYRKEWLFPVKVTTMLENQHDQSCKSPQLINKFIYFNTQIDILQATTATRTTHRNSRHEDR